MTDLRLVVVGTGTGVGKTHVARVLIEAWEEQGVQAVGLKPVESGVSESAREPSDQAQLLEASQRFHVKRGLAPTFHVKRALYAWPEPVSPHLAARTAGVRVDLAAIHQWIQEHSAPIVVIETAGGLFSPLGDEALTNADLLATLQPCAVLVVAPDRLGVLHDLTATLGLASARGLPALGVALSTPARLDASTGRNAEELARLGIASPLAVFPRAPTSNPRSREAAAAVIRWAQEAYSDTAE